MIDSKILKENPNSIKEMFSKRNMEFHLDDLFSLDKNRRNTIVELQNTNQKKNKIAKEIAIRRKNNIETIDQIQEMNLIGEKIKALEKENREIEEKYKKLLYNIPNFFHDSVPIGKDESANKIIRAYNKNASSDNLDTKYGYIATSGRDDNNDTTSTNTQIKNHIKISHELDLLDLERAGKIAGARFYFLKNDLVKLGLA